MYRHTPARPPRRAGAPLATGLLLAVLIPTATAADLALVVDDLGYSLPRSERVIALPGPVTLGVLPFAPNAAAVARRARLAGKEVILHQPMEPMPAVRTAAARGTLTLAMPPERFATLLEAALGAVPHIVGVNNHTGSLLTQHAEPMNRLMRALGERGLFFLDSRTTDKTVAMDAARRWRVPAIRRDVFLDHLPEPAAIEHEFQRALGIARRQGHAVVIAHPHPATLAYLERALAALPADVRLRAISALVAPRGPAAPDPHGTPAYPRISLGQ